MAKPQKGVFIPFDEYTIRHGWVKSKRDNSIELYHRTTINGVRKRTHTWLAEKALGKSLPEGAHVHHMNENMKSDKPIGLVICPNAAYHMLIHARQRAFDICGNANWICCRLCKTYDDPVNMNVLKKNPLVGSHKECRKDYVRKKYR